MSPAKCSVARRIGLRRRALRTALVLPAVGFAACTGESFGPLTGFSNCSLPLTNFTDAGVERSSIPALTNPEVATRLIAPHVGYVNRSDLVIGLEFNGQPLAIPLKLLWYHEVLNLQADVDSTVAGATGERLTVTYSPLTGSVSVFDPEPSGTPDFAVSSYVLDNNLVMDDGSGTLYPQLTRSATCGPQDGISLTRVPYELMVYGAWLQVFQDTWIATRVTGHDFLYTLYPYGNYRDPDNASLFYPTSAPIDLRRRPKERVVGVPSGTGGYAFAISDLREVAARDQEGQNFTVWAASARVGGEPVVAFWNSIAQSARIYRARVNGRSLTFEVVDGRRQDVETGSVWNFGGEAVVGPLDGERLEPHPESYHAFWFAWAAFQPDTEVWVPPIPLTGSADFVPADDATLLPPDPDLLRRRPR
ncbi:DUF3179 domain-containing (seleno)protein [Candidatus Palauibacter sp.]|uniref:DUF3179 domain-containing (seleno)protein n=1 Tax=Candidatus Palauibacter sp. TaxID=3101350 RepID=UPI003B51BFE6